MRACVRGDTIIREALSGAQNAGVDHGFGFNLLRDVNAGLDRKVSPSKSRETSRRENWRERKYLQSSRAYVAFILTAELLSVEAVVVA